MIIFLGVVVELATVLGTIAITINGSANSILEIFKNGYKIDKEVLDEYQKKQAEAKKEKNTVSKKVLRTILLFVPGVNMLRAGISSVNMKKAIMNDPQIKEVLVPMTDQEKEQYAKMKGKLQKLVFTAFTYGKEHEEKECCGFVGNRLIVVDHGLTSLYYKELPLLEYTLDEVKKLNEATTFSYRIGTIDGRNVAIIGIPNPNSSIDRIQFKSEDYKITYDYTKMTEETAKDKKFVVYPFYQEFEKDEKVQECYEKIKIRRTEGATRTNIEEIKVQPQIQPNDQEFIEKESISKEEQGPVLIKTLNSKIK